MSLKPRLSPTAQLDGGTHASMYPSPSTLLESIADENGSTFRCEIPHG